MGSAISTTLGALPPLRDFILPTPEAYVTLLNIFQYFPLFTTIQWLTPWHPAGKTSLKHTRFNIPGRVGWFAMEIIGPINLIFILWKLPARLNIETLPLPNKLVASLYILHYVNRAIISPFFAAPSMSPMHVFVVVMAMLFNWFNSTCLAGWLVGYDAGTAVQGPIYPGPESGSTPALKFFEDGGSTTTSTSLLLPSLGLALFFIGMAGNIYSERTLFRLRRDEADRRVAAAASQKSSTHGEASSSPPQNKYSKVYVIPRKTGPFRSILYPHYVFEWLEWTGFALVGLTVFPSLSAPSFLETRASSPSPGGATTTGAAGGTLHVPPWIRPFVYLARKLQVPVLPLPAMVFVVNAVANMLPHARWGRKWYIERFGEEAVGGRGAVVPFCGWM